MDHKTKIKIALLGSLFFLPCTAMEEGKLPSIPSSSIIPFTEAQEAHKWRLTGDFNRQLDSQKRGSPLRRLFVITSTVPQNFIKDISLCEYGQDKIAIRVFFNPVPFSPAEKVEEMRKVDWKGSGSFEGHYVVSENKDDFPIFLSILYEKKLISDYVVDHIKQQLEKAGYALDDFRLNAEKFLNLVKEKMGNNATFKDARRIFIQELNKIRNPNRRHTIVWEVVQVLQKYDTPIVSHPLLIDLLKQVNDPQHPVYSPSQRELAQLVPADETSSLTNSGRSRERLKYLLSAGSDPEAQKELKIHVPHFYFNDSLAVEPVPKELRNVAFTPDAVVGLLDLLRKQKLELDKQNSIMAQQKAEIEQLRKQLNKE